MSSVRGFKIGVTKWIRNHSAIRDVWQRNYREHIIRNEQELNRIRESIRSNPAQWEMDRVNPSCRGEKSFAHDMAPTVCESSPGCEIGVIADTHGLLRPGVVEMLAGCWHIFHAGDIGNPEILEQLKSMAPVFTVRGNIDRGRWAKDLPVREVIDINGGFLYLE